MRFLLPVVLTAALGIAADFNVDGTWKVVSTGSAPKTVGSIILDLKVDGSTVTGKVVIGAWPGEADIADAKIDDGHLTFTATGHRDSTTAIPTCKFDVTIEGDELHLSMTAIKNAGGPLPYGYTFKYIGRRKPI